MYWSNQGHYATLWSVDKLVVEIHKGLQQDAISVNSDSTGYSSAEEEAETMPGGQVKIK